MSKMIINGELREPTQEEIEKFGLDKPVGDPPNLPTEPTQEERLSHLESENRELKQMIAKLSGQTIEGVSPNA